MDQNTSLTKQAVEAALNQNWPEAIELNQKILDGTPQEAAALNRLGFAQLQLGKLHAAKSTYKKVLDIDKYNPIAKKGLAKIQLIKNSPQLLDSTKIFIRNFIEEPGKTKTAKLLRPANPQLLASLTPGAPVKLQLKKKRVLVETITGKYLGCLPDDIGFRLTQLIKKNYQYQAAIKSASQETLCIFIQETERPKHLSNQSSFPTSSTTPLSKPNKSQIENFPIDVTPTGEDDLESD